MLGEDTLRRMVCGDVRTLRRWWRGDCCCWEGGCGGHDARSPAKDGSNGDDDGAFSSLGTGVGGLC